MNNCFNPIDNRTKLAGNCLWNVTLFYKFVHTLIQFKIDKLNNVLFGTIG